MSAKAEKVGRVFSICFAVVNAVTFVLLLNVFLHTRAKFAALFKDLLEGAALPMLTTVFFALSPTLITVVSLFSLVLLIAKEWLRPVWVPMFLNALWLALGCALCLLFTAAMLAPLLGIITKMGN